MTTRLLCTTHTPLLTTHRREPSDWEDLQAAFLDVEGAVRAADTARIVLFGCLPGAAAAGAPAWQLLRHAHCAAGPGAYPGELAAPADLTGAAEKALATLPDTAIEPATNKTTLDAAFSQPLGHFTDGVGAQPTLVLAVNPATDSLRFAHSRALGTALGTALRTTFGSDPHPTLLIASGHLSHQPASTADPDELALQIAREERTAVHMRINPDIDETLLDALTSGDLARFDAFEGQALCAAAGDGVLEVHAWLAATAAHLAAGGSPPQLEFYSERPEYDGAFALAWGN